MQHGVLGSYDDGDDTILYMEPSVRPREHRGSSQIWFAEYQADPDGACKEPPRANLWHFFLDAFDKKRWIETSGYRHKDVIVTQKIIDQKAWVSAILTPLLARHGGKLKVRLSVSR